MTTNGDIATKEEKATLVLKVLEQVYGNPFKLLEDPTLSMLESRITALEETVKGLLNDYKW